MKHIISIMIGMCFLTMSISTAFAGEQLWEFDSDSDDWKVANGNWSVTDGVYQLTKGGAAEHTLAGESSWSDYTIEAKVRIDDGNWAGIAFRAKSEWSIMPIISMFQITKPNSGNTQPEHGRTVKVLLKSLLLEESR